MAGFDADWLAARRPFDDAALDRGAIEAIRAWAGARGEDDPVTVVDLGSGTGVALRRTVHWLCGRPVRAFAVDADARLLAGALSAWSTEQAGASARRRAAVWSAPGAGTIRPYVVSLGGRTISVTPIVGDLLGPLGGSGGPAARDGAADLVLGHALADLLPLDRLAARVAALLRPGGLTHLALTYDGETVFAPADRAGSEARVIDAYHRHMDRPRLADPAYGGSTAGRRLPDELARAGLDVLRAAPAVWDVRAEGGDAARTLLERMLRFVVEAVRELGEPDDAVRAWAAGRRADLAAGRLELRVRHLDVLARRSTTGSA